MTRAAVLPYTGNGLSSEAVDPIRFEIQMGSGLGLGLARRLRGHRDCSRDSVAALELHCALWSCVLGLSGTSHRSTQCSLCVTQTPLGPLCSGYHGIQRTRLCPMVRITDKLVSGRVAIVDSLRRHLQLDASAVELDHGVKQCPGHHGSRKQPAFSLYFCHGRILRCTSKRYSQAHGTQICRLTSNRALKSVSNLCIQATARQRCVGFKPGTQLWRHPQWVRGLLFRFHP